MKKVIVISTSLRTGSNSDMLADRFIDGAKSAGNDVEKISLVGKNIQFCKGCFGCQKLGRCVIKDDVNDIMAKVLKADVICWATPIYYYEMSGQMKTLIDRMNAMYPWTISSATSICSQPQPRMRSRLPNGPNRA